MKDILTQAQNKVNIVGKLLDVTFGSGKLSDGRAYERASFTTRVNQSYGGRMETSEITSSIFAPQLTSKGTPNPAWKTIQTLKELKTVQDVGLEEADSIRLDGRTTNLRENAFVTKSGQFINSWQINASFINSVTGKAAADEVASFTLDIFIMDMHPEEDRDGDPTGRLIIKGGVVQYGGKLDVIEFIVESPDSVDFVERNWNVNDTVTVRGRIRVTSIEQKPSGANGSWGEEIPETVTKFVRELIITTGDDAGKDDEFAYDPVDIKKAFNVRKANLEQLQLDAKKANATASKPAATSSAKYSWE